MKDFDEALTLDPANASAFRGRGLINTRQRRYEPAIADFTEAIRLDPSVAAAYEGRAEALRYSRQSESAIADYRKALSLRIDDATRKRIEMFLRQLGVV